MPENTPNSPNNPKKARLGRGLGSLLGGAPDLGAEPMAATQVAVGTPSSQMPATSPVATPQVASMPIQQPAGASAGGPRVVVVAPPESTLVKPQPQAPPINEEAQIWKVPVDRLVPNTQQPRRTFTPEALKDLSASIREHGILQPITARRLGERQFEIIAGERRWRAAQAAGLHEVPVILKKVSEKDSLELAIIENIQRENLNPMEEAEAYQNLMSDYSLTQQQVADRLGKERSTIANSIRLLVLPAEVRDLIRKMELSTGHAKVILGLESSQAQISVAKQAVSEKLSVRATEKLVAKTKTETRAGSQASNQGLNVDVSSRLISGLSAELQKLIGTKVSIDYSEGKGKLNINFYSDDQLSQIVEKLRRAWEK
jgi:ParB family transcriptional regulator, chromosome partitioning protein